MSVFDYTSPRPRELLERYGVPEDVIDGVLGMHAHELAEGIREHFRARFSSVTSAMGVAAAQRWIQGADRAADYIDPEVE